MSRNGDSFYDDDEVGAQEQSGDHQLPAPPKTTIHADDEGASEMQENTNGILSIPVTVHSPNSSPPSRIHSTSSSPPSRIHSTNSSPPSRIHATSSPPRSASSASSSPRDKKEVLCASNKDVEVQTDQIVVYDESVQTETVNRKSSLKSVNREPISISEQGILATPLVKTLLDQRILSALPIISFCQPFSMTSYANDIILTMPRHLMIINNQNSVSVYPWQQSQESVSTILDCFWCPFLYKLLVTTLEENRLFIYDFISIIDSIKLRGHPLSIKHQSYYSKETNSSQLLLPSSRHQTVPAMWSQTRFTKSNSWGIYYCYISDRHHSCMLTRVDHNTRQHIKAIDCSGDGINSNICVCAMGLTDERVAIVLTNLNMTLYDAKTLLGLRQLNLSRWNSCNIRGISSLIYLWKTWLVLDPIENKIVGIGKRKRQFVKMLPEQPINACSTDNGTLALWLGYPGTLFCYRLIE